jgi:hypothetical protein
MQGKYADCCFWWGTRHTATRAGVKAKLASVAKPLVGFKWLGMALRALVVGEGRGMLCAMFVLACMAL